MDISLRTVAAEPPSPVLLVTVCEPTGCAVSTYCSTIARSTAALRSSSSVILYLSLPLALNRTECQGGRVTRCRPGTGNCRSGEQEPGRQIGCQHATGAGEDDSGSVALEQALLGQLRYDGGGADSGPRPRPHPKGEGEALLGPRLGIEDFRARDRRSVAGDCGDVPLRRADVPPPAPIGVSVRGATDPDVLATGPVQLVVPARLARSRPVRDLVPLESGRGEHRVGPQVGVGLEIAVGRGRAGPA